MAHATAATAQMMPETGPKRRLSLAILAASLGILSLMLSSFADAGDFGRERRSILAERIGVYPFASTGRGHHTRLLPYTDAEIRLRSYADALVRTYAHVKTHGTFSDFVPVLPRKVTTHFKGKLDAEGYRAWLGRSAFRSTEGRLNAITEDIRADMRNIDGLWSAVVTVYQDDTARVLEIERGYVRPGLAKEILRRIENNRDVIEFVLDALGEKLAGYRLALHDAYLIEPHGGHAGARLEYDAMRRRVTVFHANLGGLDELHSMSLPRSGGCVSQSLARIC